MGPSECRPESWITAEPFNDDRNEALGHRFGISASDGRDPNDQCEHLVHVEVRLDATGCTTYSLLHIFEERP